MIKAIVLLSRLAHLTRAQFATYYESNHAPFIQTILPGFKLYRRNYISESQSDVWAGPVPPFDDYTELEFADEAAYNRFLACTQEPEILRMIRDDEAHFLDHTKSVLFRAEACTSEIKLGHNDLKGNMVKVIVLLSRLPHITREEFARYYEEHHAPFILTVLPDIKLYRRNHVIGNSEGPEDQRINAAPFDTLTELRFSDEAAYQRFANANLDPDIIARIRADEANFLDHTKTLIFRVDEYSSMIP